MSSSRLGIEQTSDGVTVTGTAHALGPLGGGPWKLNVRLTGDVYSREDVAGLLAEVLEEIQNPTEEFTIEDAGIPAACRQAPDSDFDGMDTAPPPAASANPSATSTEEAAIPVAALRYATVAELAPNCFAQAEIGFHNLTVVRRAGDETELLIRVAGGAGAHFTLKPDERNALVAALMAAP